MKIAALVDDLTLSQCSFFLVKNFNTLARESNIVPYCFYQNLSGVPVTPLFGVMHVYYAAHFHGGKIIATNLSTLKTLVNLHTTAEKYLYVWDLEWLRGQYDYIENVSLLNREDVTLICRSQSHKKLVENYCNKPVKHIIENWNHHELEGLWNQKMSLR